MGGFARSIRFLRVSGLLLISSFVQAAVAVDAVMPSSSLMPEYNLLSPFKVKIRSLQKPSISVYLLVPEDAALNSDIFLYPGHSPLVVEDSLHPWDQHILQIHDGNGTSTDPVVWESVQGLLAGCRIVASSFRSQTRQRLEFRESLFDEQGGLSGIRIFLQIDDIGVYALIVHWNGRVQRVKVADRVQDFFQAIQDVLGENIAPVSDRSLIVVTIDRSVPYGYGCVIRVRFKAGEKWYDMNLTLERLCGGGLGGFTGNPFSCPLKRRKPKPGKAPISEEKYTEFLPKLPKSDLPQAFKDALEAAQEVYQSLHDAGAIDGMNDVEQLAIEIYLAELQGSMSEASTDKMDQIVKELQPLADELGRVFDIGKTEILKLRQLAEQYLGIRKIKLIVLKRVSFKGQHLHLMWRELEQQNIHLEGNVQDLQLWVKRTQELSRSSLYISDQSIGQVLTEWQEQWQAMHRKYSKFKGMPPPIPPKEK